MGDNILGEVTAVTPAEVAAADRAFDETNLPTTRIRYDSEMHVELVHFLADDLDVVNAARVSVQGLHGREYDPQAQEMLIKYLMRNRHGSPFEHNIFKFRITAPVFVMREFQRHRVGWSYNEESARYKVLEPHFWVPNMDRPLIQSGKPGYYEMTKGLPSQQLAVTEATHEAYETAWRAYRRMLNEEVCREVARTVLPVGIYSSMYATCNARSLMHFLSLRTNDPKAAYPSHPQKEIQEVAVKMEQSFSRAMPLTWHAFNAFGRVAP